MSQFKYMAVRNMPEPNMIGKAFPLTDVVAKELQAMADDLQEKLAENDLSEDTLMEVILKTCEDGIGDIEGLAVREKTKRVKPNKIFRINTIILQIRVKMPNGSYLILFKEPYPNTMFCPSR